MNQVNFRTHIKRAVAVVLAAVTVAVTAVLPAVAVSNDRTGEHNFSDPNVDIRPAYGLYGQRKNNDGTMSYDSKTADPWNRTKYNPLYVSTETNNNSELGDKDYNHFCKVESVVDEWRVKRNYFAVSYTMTLKEEYTIWNGHWSGDNGCCGLVLGGDENFGCVYIPHDYIVNGKRTPSSSESTSAPNVAFGPWWANGCGTPNKDCNISSYIGQSVTIMLVGSYMNEKDYTSGKTLRLKAYLNGKQIALWGGADEFVYKEPSNDRKFDGKLGYATKLCSTDAVGRFTQSDSPLDCTAFNDFDGVVDASQPINSAYTHYANAKQWKVTLRHFAISYTFDLKEYTGYVDGDNGCLGLIVGGSAENDDTYGCMVLNYSTSGATRTTDGNIKFGPWWNSSQLGSNPCPTVNAGSYYEDGVYKDKTIELMIVGDVSYDSKNTVKLRAYINGQRVNTVWGGSDEAVGTEFNGYVGWMTKLRGVNATVRFKQWQGDEFPADQSSLWYKDRGPVNGYWNRTITNKTTSWGATPEGEEDGSYELVDLTALPYYYDTTTPSMYQLGEIDLGREFELSVTLNNKGRTQGIYFSCDVPKDGEFTSDIDAWTNKYYLLELSGNDLVLYKNVGDGLARRCVCPQNVYKSINSSGELRVKLVFDESKTQNLNVYVGNPDDLGESLDPEKSGGWCAMQNIATDTNASGRAFGLYCANGKSEMGKRGSTFKALKISYGLAQPNDDHATHPGLQGYAQTRRSGDNGKYDLRVLIEGTYAGLNGGTGQNAKIIVKFTKSSDASAQAVTVAGDAQNNAYREMSFYDAEYFFHAADDCGILALVVKGIPIDYDNYVVYFQFVDTSDNPVGSLIKIGECRYSAETSENYSTGSAAPN